MEFMGLYFFFPQVPVMTEHPGTAANDMCEVCNNSIIPGCSPVFPFSRCLYSYFAMTTEPLALIMLSS